ncbi:pogo transposable element with ZNF domain [Aulostomus maculatus]
METELFMECEEEELEPWQQVDDSVEEDEMDFYDTYEPAFETPPLRTPPTITLAASAPSPAQMTHPTPSALPSSSSPATAAATPLMAQAPPLFLTQTAGGTFLLPAAAGAGNAPPILLTTQGFPVQTMMKPGTPLLLNLQPGQTVQPLTLIQCRLRPQNIFTTPSLGQLVRPGVGVSSVLPQGQARSAPSAQGMGTGYTTMQLPTTLTICTSTPGPVNFQFSQLGGTKALKLAGSPIHPSDSANGVTRAPLPPPFSSSLAAPGPSPSTISTLRVTSAPTSDPSKVVMSVEEFYYGTFEGDLSLRRPHPLGIKPLTYTCWTCSHSAENNLRLMQHMLQHSDLVVAGKEKKCCKFCYRQISSPSQLHIHQEQVHSSAPSSCMCRICEWAFENEPAFLNHMKSNHKPGEMPYVCQVCSYRSSFYSDVLQHFASFHRDSRFLLCVFCLKVTRNPTSYQQHLLRHQVTQAFHCNRCRLQFVFLKDKMQHKLENHRSVRRPAKLEGLPPGSKVTIRTYGKLRCPVTSAGGGTRLLQSPSPLIQPINIKTEQQRSPTHRTPPQSKPPRSPTKRSMSRKIQVNRSSSLEGDRLVCLECGTVVSDFSAHYPTHVHCLLCPYRSCCSRAYAAHMIHHHVPQSKDKALPLHRLPPPCPFLLQCSQCDFRPVSADQMAHHLLMNPKHYGATCRTRTYIEPDIRFLIDDGQQEPVQNKDLPDPSWKSADRWRKPSESEDSKSSIVPFMQTSGPQHLLSRNCDAIDYFQLLFPAALVGLITSETNAHAKTCHYLGSSYPDWVPVTTHEVKGFIGLCILMGIQNLPDLSHYWSWSHYDNSYTFYRTMSLKRFKQISANIRMGSFATDDYRRTGNPSDSLHIFRPMLDLLGEAMWNAYKPNCCLTIDRALLPTLEGESCHFRGNPKTQPQVWLLCDSKSGYCHRFFIQVGGKAEQDVGFTVVPELVRGLEDKHHQLYLANSLTSVPLMQKLLDQGIYASSSFPPPSPILPRELWEDGKLEDAGHFLQRQFGPLLATRWRDTKEMGCLSTNAASGEADTVWRRSQTKVGGLDPINRPLAFRLLQENMRGVDICKQLLACNPMGGILLDRHWRSLFWFLINLAIVNAFIVLRESRRENPPAWVQDGLFTQVNFRKRLGNQLAKCAQRYFETMEIATSRGIKVEPVEEPVKQRHRMTKISSISKRCKNCNLKNVRHESVYGCVICKANLCNQPSCFWEFHGLSPFNKGSTKLGFVRNRLSGEVEVDEVHDNMDQSMAPVEDLDFSDDERFEDQDEVDEETEDIQEESDKDSNCLSSPLPSAANSQLASKDRDDFLTARQLRITLYALCDGLHQASRVFATNAHVIRSWWREARNHFKQTEEEHQVHEYGSERMVAWVLSMREQQLPISESSLFNKASILKKKGGFGDSFRISYDWAVSFMLQHQLGVRSVGKEASLARTLPPSLEAKIKSFKEFTKKVTQVHKLPARGIAAVDELCLFVDLKVFQDKSRRAEALDVTGTLPLVTVYLSALADGTMLPALVLTDRPLAEKILPDFALLEASPQTVSVEEAMDIWTKRIWLPHVSGPPQSRKSMLVLDRHREHMSDPFLTVISGAGTLPVVIPGGCSTHLQPLEICVKPVLQRFLLTRWAKFVTKEWSELEEIPLYRLQTNITKLVIDWVVEALTHLNGLPHIWKKSFNLTGLLPVFNLERDEVDKREDDDVEMKKVDEMEKTKDDNAVEKMASMVHKKESNVEKLPGDKMEKIEDIETPGQNVEEAQLDLLKTLTEILLGSEGLDSSDLLELEDETDTDEEGQETSAEKQKDKEQDRKGTEEERKFAEKDHEKEEDNIEEDSEEEGKEAEEEKNEVSKERRETRIVIGEEVGDEWKITVKNRAEVDGHTDES